MTTSATQSSPDSWAQTPEQWLLLGVHHAELPSTMRVSFRRLTVGELITAGQLPNDLRELAYAEFHLPRGALQTLDAELDKLPDQPSDEQLADVQVRLQDLGEQIARLTRELCAQALIAPALTATELERAPVEDLMMLAGLVSGRLHMDAAGRVIGVAPLSDFETFRDQHGCPADCEGCTGARRELSTVQPAEAM